ncbi:RcnB family protein [Ramlibacter sp. RBP-2]|uniref:RcnB family protein n=1 Tax=Ramlibacter lithotrophicus TaxID=2606681 RepID=A0A7X6I7H1_9BURK|nr:RcnB family protein [Ramlibacter lithotrophicus]NKE67341.1 RcnB family protein [Ramlibacter lithotrophicus]
MSGKASPFTAAALALALAVAGLGTPAVAQPDDRGRGGRGDERRWVQQGEPRGDRGGDRRWVQPADPRGGRDRQDRREQRRFEAERPDGWRGQGGERWGRQPQDHPGRGGPPVYVQPPVHVQPPAQVQPSPQWQGRGDDRAERRWNPRAPRLRPGDPLPSEYRQRQFVVNDWRAHRLYAPPPGHQWVQPEPGNYLLIGRNGEIVNMLVGQ